MWPECLRHQTPAEAGDEKFTILRRNDFPSAGSEPSTIIPMSTNTSAVLRNTIAVAVLVATLGMRSALGGNFIFHDQTFAAGTWNATIVGGTRVSGASLTRVIGDGIPGDSLRTTIFGTGSFTFDVAVMNTSVAFDPGTEGAIGAINWEIWYKVPNAGSFAGLRLLAQQGDSLYVANNTYREPELFSPNWQRAHGAIQGSDFQILTGSGDPRLDFTPDADPIRFGYGLSRGVFSGGVSHQATFFYLDMQTVAVPEVPSAAWTGAGLLFGAALWRVGRSRLQKRR